MSIIGRIGALVVVPCLAMTSLAAQATFILRLSDGSALDGNGASGAVTYVGDVGLFWFSVSTALGDEQSACLGIQLDSVSISGSGAGPVQIAVTETDLDFGVAGPTMLAARFSGVAVGTIHGQVFVDDGNMAFSTTVQVFHSGTLGAGAFDSAGASLANLNDPFSMSMFVDIRHIDFIRFTSFNFGAEEQVPEPTSLALAGAALFGLSALGRRRKP